MNKKERIDLALKLTEIKFKNYTCENYANYCADVYDFFIETLKDIEKEDTLR